MRGGDGRGSIDGSAGEQQQQQQQDQEQQQGMTMATGDASRKDLRRRPSELPSALFRNVQNAVSMLRGSNSMGSPMAATSGNSGTRSPRESSGGTGPVTSPDGGRTSLSGFGSTKPSPLPSPLGSPKGTPRASMEGNTLLPMPVLSTRLTYQPPSSFARAQRRSSVMHAVRSQWT